MTTTWLRTSFLVSCLGVVAALGAACSSAEDAPKYPTTDSFCAEKAKVECTSVASVCGVGQDACLATRKQKCLEFAAANVSPSRAYKPANAEACINAVTTAFKDQRLSVKEEDETAPGSMGERCARVFEGKAAKNETCVSSFDCAGALVCGVNRVNGALACATRVEKKLNDPCANVGESCAVGSYCSVLAGAVCTASKKKDEACSIDNPADKSYAPCGETLLCDKPSGKCVDRVGPGGTCLSHSDCASAAPYCYATTSGKKCTTELIFSPEASVCTEYGKS